MIQLANAQAAPSAAQNNTSLSTMPVPVSPMAPSINNAPNVVIPGSWDVLPIPPAMTLTVASAAGGGALSKTAYFLNEATFKTTPTDNGSGAGSITSTYGDGWSGKGYSQLSTILSANGGNGIQCFGFTLVYTVIATGAQDPAGVNVAAPTLLVANLVGANQIPRGFVLPAGTRNTQYLAGTMTIATQFTLNVMSQFSFVVPAGDTVSLTVLTQPF